MRCQFTAQLLGAKRLPVEDQTRAGELVFQRGHVVSHVVRHHDVVLRGPLKTGNDLRETRSVRHIGRADAGEPADEARIGVDGPHQAAPGMGVAHAIVTQDAHLDDGYLARIAVVVSTSMTAYRACGAFYGNGGKVGRPILPRCSEHWPGSSTCCSGRVEDHRPPGLKQYIVVVAPHTSNWDFPSACSYAASVG